MIRIQIIKAGYGKKPGMVIDVNEFEASHLTAFGFAVPFVESKPKYEKAVAEQPEIRIETKPVNSEPVPELESNPLPSFPESDPALSEEKISIIPEIFRKRRGRRKKT